MTGWIATVWVIVKSTEVVTRARDFIQRYGLSRFQPYTTSKVNGNVDQAHAQRIQNLAGYLVDGRREDGRKEYHIIPSVFEVEILCGIQKNWGRGAGRCRNARS